MRIVLGFILGAIAAQVMFIPWGNNNFSRFEWRNNWNGVGELMNREDYQNNREVCLYRMETVDSWHTGSNKINCINGINNLLIDKA